MQFWDLLDFISADTYVPLINSSGLVPSLAQMQSIFTNYMRYFEAWLQSQPANVSSLPVVWSEVGYPSSAAGLAAPSANPPDVCSGAASANLTLQAMAFQALFAAAPEFEWLRGLNVFWFDNPSSPGYYPDRDTNGWACDWTVRGKPAEKIIAGAFQKGAN